MALGWVFCRVIDNLGDVGVSWRLCKLLKEEENLPITLIIDNLHALSKLVPQCNISMREQVLDGIQVVLWDDLLEKTLSKVPQPKWVIETFGCDLPNFVLERMENTTDIWLNLEYLTAEDWAKDIHLMPSLQSNGLEKYFYFLGFDDKMGGLIREQDYLNRYQAFNNQKKQEFRQLLGLPIKTDAFSVFLFTYPTKNWPYWFMALEQSNEKIELLISNPDVWKILCDTFALDASQDVAFASQNGNLTAYLLPMVKQSDFDCLLWVADFLFIRGEESFVRAQFTQKPFLWHIYQQEEKVHLEKLEAFNQLIYQGLPEDLLESIQFLSLSINDEDKVVSTTDIVDNWLSIKEQWQAWSNCSAKWSMNLLQQESAIQKLASLIKSKVKY